MTKSILKLIAISTLSISILTSSASAAANGIDLDATVSTSLIAGFSDVSAENGNGLFVDNALNTISFGTVSPGGTHTPVTQQIFLKTNNVLGAELTLTDAINSGNLVGPGVTIPVSYTFGGIAIILGVSFDLSSSSSNGTISMGDFVATPTATASDQVAGTYATNLSITLAAK